LKMTATYPDTAADKLPERKKNNSYISAAEAAKRADVVLTTVSNWAKRHPELGIKVMGRWRIDPSQLQRILEGQPLRNSR
jgi:transposase